MNNSGAQKIVTSERFGGFGVSTEGLTWLNERGVDNAGDRGKDIDRDNPLLVEMVETLGEAASDHYSALVVVTIPDGVEWHIHEYDGMESVHEKHRTWTSDGLEECF